MLLTIIWNVGDRLTVTTNDDSASGDSKSDKGLVCYMDTLAFFGNTQAVKEGNIVDNKEETNYISSSWLWNAWTEIDDNEEVD